MTDENKPSFEREIRWELRAGDLEHQLATMTAERDEITSRWEHEFELRCKEEDKNDQLQARLTASEQEAGRLKAAIDTLTCAVCKLDMQRALKKGGA